MCVYVCVCVCVCVCYAGIHDGLCVGGDVHVKIVPFVLMRVNVCDYPL